MQYIATAKRSKKFEGNIWTKQKDGRYTCLKMSNFILEQWQIDHDVSLGYLKKV